MQSALIGQWGGERVVMGKVTKIALIWLEGVKW